MNNQDYEQKRRECWKEYCEGDELYDVQTAFDFAFRHAYDLGKQAKDTIEVILDKEEYEELCKYRRYMANWAFDAKTCPKCGELNPDGYKCLYCEP